MVDVILLFGKIALIGLLYLFLIAVIRAGTRSVASGPAASGAAFSGGSDWSVLVERGPAELRGVRVPLDGPVIIGRSAQADITIADTFVSNRHARIAPTPGGPMVEDLGSTNGTVVNDRLISRPTNLSKGDRLTLGDVVLRVDRG